MDEFLRSPSLWSLAEPATVASIRAFRPRGPWRRSSCSERASQTALDCEPLGWEWT